MALGGSNEDEIVPRRDNLLLLSSKTVISCTIASLSPFGDSLIIRDFGIGSESTKFLPSDHSLDIGEL